MNYAQLTLAIGAFTFAASALAAVVRISIAWQRIKSDVTYIRRDLDQLLKLYRLTPAVEQDRRRRR